MTREEAKTKFNHNHAKNDYEAVWLDSVIDWIYNDIEDYLKTQMNNERRDFRDRCIFREVLEHIGGKDDIHIMVGYKSDMVRSGGFGSTDK